MIRTQCAKLPSGNFVKHFVNGDVYLCCVFDVWACLDLCEYANPSERHMFFDSLVKYEPLVF